MFSLKDNFFLLDTKLNIGMILKDRELEFVGTLSLWMWTMNLPAKIFPTSMAAHDKKGRTSDSVQGFHCQSLWCTG